MFTKFMRLKELFSGKSTETDYAETIADNIQTIDEHDHTGGKGAPIPITAIRADSNLNLQNNAVVDASALSLTDAEISTIPNQSAFVDGGDLYWKNDSGNIVRITNENNLAGLSPQGEGFTDDFTDAVVSGNNLRLIRRDGTVLSVLLPSTNESQNDFVSGALVMGNLRLTKRDGTFVDITLPRTAESQNDFVDAGISGQVLTLTRRDASTVDITIPTNVIDPNAAITESQDDFTDAVLSGNQITLTKRNGDTVELDLPTFSESTNDYVDATIASNTLTLTKRDASTTDITLPTFAESQDDFISVTLNEQTLTFTRRNGTTLSIILPDPSSGTVINVQELVSKTIGGDYSSDDLATVNYSTSRQNYTFKATSSILAQLTAKSFAIENSSNNNRRVVLEGSDSQSSDYSLKTPPSLPTGNRPLFLNNAGEITTKRIEGEDIESGSITRSKISGSLTQRVKRKASIAGNYSISNVSNLGRNPELSFAPRSLITLSISRSSVTDFQLLNGFFVFVSFAYRFISQSGSTLGAGLWPAGKDIFGIRRIPHSDSGSTETDLVTSIASDLEYVRHEHWATGFKYVNFSYFDIPFENEGDIPDITSRTTILSYALRLHASQTFAGGQTLQVMPYTNQETPSGRLVGLVPSTPEFSVTSTR